MSVVWEPYTLLSAWDDLDRALDGVSDEDMLTQFESGSCFAWTVAHVTQGVDSWINVRFQGHDPQPLIAEERFRYGGDGKADDWPAILAAVDEVRDRARGYILSLKPDDLDRMLTYDGSVRAFREHGMQLRMAIVQNAIHHYYHVGEIVTKRELIGQDAPGTYPSMLVDALAWATR